MPGSGFKTFNTGDILTAADVNGYLMKQAVMYFATAAARSAALTAPEEGMITYLADTNAVEKYTGSAWVNVNDNTDAILKTIVDAKGDLIAGTAADTVDRLAVGTNGQVLTADSSTATGLKWAAGSAGALTFISGQTVSAASSVIFNDVFSSTYQNYLIISSLIGSGAAAPVDVRMRSGGVDASGSNYGYENLQVDGTSVTAGRFTGSSFPAFAVVSTSPTVCQMMVYRPNEAESTLFQPLGTFDASATPILTYRGAYHNLATAYTGISFIVSSGTATGTIRIYGLQNS